MKETIILLVGAAVLILGLFYVQSPTHSLSYLQRDAIELTVIYDDGSQKNFSFAEAKSLSDLFELAAATTVGLETKVWPDRGAIRILAYEIDGLGHTSESRWAITRNGDDYWPDMEQFSNGPLAGGDNIVFTLYSSS